MLLFATMYLKVSFRSQFNTPAYGVRKRSRMFAKVRTATACVSRLRSLLLLTPALCEIQPYQHLIDGYQLLKTHPAAAAAQLKLDGGECGAAEHTDVTMQIYVDRFHPLDQNAKTWGLDGFVRAWWTDLRLRYRREDNATCASMVPEDFHLSRDETRRIWRPDLYWEDVVDVKLPALEMGYTDGAGEMMSVSPDGTVFWSRQARFTLSCQMDMALLPFDSQQCSHMAGLYSQKADHVQLRWKPEAEAIANRNSRSNCISGWVVTAHAQEDVVQSFSSGNYTYAKATLTFTRQPKSFLLNHFMQSAVMVIISWLGFLIDPEATPARVALGIITVMVVLQNYIALSSELPAPDDDHWTWLGYFVLVSFMFNVLAFVEQVLVSFGLQGKKWLDKQRLEIESLRNWKDALHGQTGALMKLFYEWDKNKDGVISKKEFRRGVKMLIPTAPLPEVNAMFDNYDIDKTDSISLTEMANMLADVSKAGRKVSVSAEAPETRQAVAVRVQTARDAEAEGDVPQLHVTAQPKSERLSRASPTQSPGLSRDTRGSKDSARVSTREDTSHAVLHQTRSKSIFRQVNLAASVTAHLALSTKQPANTSIALRREMRTLTKTELEKDNFWMLKTYFTFPCVAWLRHLDHISRLLFPVAYTVFVVAHLSQVNFGRDHSEKLLKGNC